MRDTLDIAIDAIRPDSRAILAGIGYPTDREPDSAVSEILTRAIDLFHLCADPCGVFEEVTAREFANVYQGEGDNEPASPVQDIFPRAEHLALFAVTIGDEVSGEIERLFAENEYPLAAALDVVASEATERAGDVVQRSFLDHLVDERTLPGETAVLRYSPGYCGWHVSGQGYLFRALHPEEIGITLLQSFLMEPLKSMSGVLVAGPPGIHHFRPVYPFCSQCETRDCVERARTAPRVGAPERSEGS